VPALPQRACPPCLNSTLLFPGRLNVRTDRPRWLFPLLSLLRPFFFSFASQTPVSPTERISLPLFADPATSIFEKHLQLKRVSFPAHHSQGVSRFRRSFGASIVTRSIFLRPGQSFFFSSSQWFSQAVFFFLTAAESRFPTPLTNFPVT